MASESVKRLRALLADDIIPARQMAVHVRQLTGRNDRLVAVVGGSVVEANLRSLLIAALPAMKLRYTHTTKAKSGIEHLHYGYGEISDKLFGPKAPLSTLSAKIDLAYAMGLINDDIRRNAHHIREIRNVFAHKIAPVSFRTKEVSAVCKLLVLAAGPDGREPPVTGMRNRFIQAAMHTGVSIAVFRTHTQFPKGGQPASLRRKYP